MNSSGKSVLVVHPMMSFYAGGEILCIYACKAMQELGYHVFLFCDEYDLDQIRKRWGETAYKTMKDCEWVEFKWFKPKIPFLRSYQRILWEITNYRPVRKLRKKAEFVLSTQQLYLDSRLYNYCVVYEMKSTLFRFGLFQDPNSEWYEKVRWYQKPVLFYYNHFKNFSDSAYNRTTFIGESKYIVSQLEKSGLKTAKYLQAPCQPSFKIGLKKPYVVQVTRLNPAKRPEMFAEIARNLPDYQFILVYMIPDREREIGFATEEYEREFLKKCPPNLMAVKRLILECPEYVEEAKVYLYTGRESGATTSLGQAALAGCIPIAPRHGGGEDQITDLGYGYTYRNVEEAIGKVRLALESDIDPIRIAENAKIFLPETFIENLKKIVGERVIENTF